MVHWAPPLGDHSDPSDNQTDPRPVPETEGLAEKPPARDRNDDEGERDEGYAALRGMCVSSQTHRTVAAA